MKTKFRSLTFGAAAGLGLLALSCAPAFADDNDWHWGHGMMGRWFMGEMMNRDMMDGWGPGMMMGRYYSTERLNFLKSALAITVDQAKLWDAYAGAVQIAAENMRKSHLNLLKSDTPNKLPERLALHEAMMSSNLEAMKSVNAATLALYDKLTDAQKAKADDLIAGTGMM